MTLKQGRSLGTYLASSAFCPNERFWEKRALFASSGNLCSFGGPGIYCINTIHCEFFLETAVSHKFFALPLVSHYVWKRRTLQERLT